MIRVVIAAAAALAVAAFVFGVVLNGFGLVDDPNRRPVAQSSPDAARPSGSAASDAVAGGAASPSPGRPEATDAAVDDRTPDTATAIRSARDVTPPNVLARPTSRYVPPEAVRDDQPDQQAEAAEEPDIRRYHRVVVRDARTLESGGETIRLAGVSPVAADKSCTDETGRSWPCGRVAAAALRMLIRHRAIDCTVVARTDEGIVGTCSAGLSDVNGWLVEQGWAEPEAGAGYEEEADAARAQKRGIYLARWEVQGTGGTGVVPQTSFTAPALLDQPYPGRPVQGTGQPRQPAPSAERSIQGPVN